VTNYKLNPFLKANLYWTILSRHHQDIFHLNVDKISGYFGELRESVHFMIEFVVRSCKDTMVKKTWF